MQPYVTCYPLAYILKRFDPFSHDCHQGSASLARWIEADVDPTNRNPCFWPDLSGGI